jgi:hypothetical protein
MTHGATDMLFKEVNACAELEKIYVCSRNAL